MSMIPDLQFRYWQWVALVLATPVVTWGAAPFHRAAWANLRHRATSMDTLISLGVAAAYTWSVWALVLGDAGNAGHAHAFRPDLLRRQDEIYLEVASVVTSFLLAGRYAETRARRRSGAALRALVELGAKDVQVIRDGIEERIPVDRLRVGDEFVVRPGEKIATDGVVIAGRSAIDTALVTGESVPREVAAGDTVVGGTLDVGGRLVVRATRVGADTQLAQIIRLVERAQSGKAAVQRLADRVSGGSSRSCSCWLRRRSPAARVRIECARRVHGGDRGTDHCLPVRTWARDPNGPDGGHRARRAARRAGEGAGSAREHAPDRHGGARQDGDGHHRRDGPGRRRGRRSRPAAPDGRGGRSGQRAPDRPGCRRRGPNAGRPAAGSDRVRQFGGTRRARAGRRCRGRRRSADVRHRRRGSRARLGGRDG